MLWLSPWRQQIGTGPITAFLRVWLDDDEGDARYVRLVAAEAIFPGVDFTSGLVCIANWGQEPMHVMEGWKAFHSDLTKRKGGKRSKR